MLVSSDANADAVDCGDGTDFSIVDKRDQLVDCESDFRPVDTFITGSSLEAGLTTRASVTFDFDSTIDGSFECALDGAGFTPCESPFVTPFLETGRHVFDVRAVSDVYGLDYVPASVAFNVELGTTAIIADRTLLVDAPEGTQDSFEISDDGSDLMISLAAGESGQGLVAKEPCIEIGLQAATCPLNEIDDVELDTGDQSDTVTVSASVPVSVYGGDGDDDLRGAARSTRLIGGRGGDVFRSSGEGPTIDYSGRSLDLSLSLNESPDDGSNGELDNLLVTSGAIIGGSGHDVIVGDDNSNELTGGPGADVVSAFGGDDIVDTADGEADEIDCGDGTDRATLDLSDGIGLGCESSVLIVSTAVTGGIAEAATTSDSTPTFEFENSAATTFVCRLDDDEPEPCASPWTASPLEDGEHALEVLAFDGTDRIDLRPARRTFTVDESPPQAQILIPQDGETTGPRPTFEFAVDESATTECFVDEVALADCETPVTVPTELAGGSHTFRLSVQDPFGNIDENADDIAFIVDPTIPETTIDTRVTDGSTLNLADLRFDFGSGTNGPLIYECKVDGGEWEYCDAPWSPELADGAHDVSIRAVSTTNLVDDTPWTVGFTIDSDLPHLSLVAGPGSNEAIRSEALSISFSANPASSFECALDSGDFAPCSSPFGPNISGDGGHIIRVRAAGSGIPSITIPLVIPVLIDDTPPSVIPTWGDPREVITDELPSFSFLSSEEGSTFRCSLDDQYQWSAPDFVECNSPWQYWLSDGTYRLTVKAVDQAGNESAAVSHEFIMARYGLPPVDTLAPRITVRLPLVAPTSGGVPIGAVSTFAAAFEANEEATFSCALDGGELSPCQSGVEFQGLSDGFHSLTVCGADPNGNSGCTSTEFEIDSVTPEQPTLTSHPADGEPGDIAQFEFETEYGSNLVAKLDDGDWQQFEGLVRYETLAAGDHSLRFKARDRAGNESIEGQFEWSSTTPQGGPYYELQAVSPAAGSSYLVWPRPNTPGAGPSVSGYRVRTCEHFRQETCTDGGWGTARWSPWEEYSAEEGHTDGVVGSRLTHPESMGTGDESVVTYEVEILNGGEQGEPERQTIVAGPWATEITQDVVIEDGHGAQADEPYIAEDEELSAALRIDVGSVGLGIKTVGAYCMSEWSHFHNGLPSRQERCASISLPTPLRTKILAADPQAVEDPDPQVVAIRNLDCSPVENQFGSEVLQCPNAWHSNLPIPAGAILEVPRNPLKFFVELTNGQVIILDRLDYEMPEVDGTPPTTPTDLEVGADATDAEGDGQIYFDWSAVGDPIGTNFDAEGSGISAFAISTRIRRRRLVGGNYSVGGG